MRPLTFALLSLTACASRTVTASDAGPDGRAADATVTADAVVTADAGADDTALAYCRATCASVVRCNPGRVAASCELACARQWGNMRLRAGLWRLGAACAAGLTCDAVRNEDGDALFQRCVLPGARGVPRSAAADGACAASEALAARLGTRCADVPTGAECALLMPLFSDAALDAARGACFGPTATCDAARRCLVDRLGLPPG